MSFCPVAEIGFTVTSERDPGRFEHVKLYIFHVPYALIRLVHVDDGRGVGVAEDRVEVRAMRRHDRAPEACVLQNLNI